MSTGAAVAGGTIGAAAGYSQANQARRAQNQSANEINSVRADIRDAYSKAQKGWVDFIPELKEGVQGNIDFANMISADTSAYNQYLDNAAAKSLGLGYQKATESIAPQLEGETFNLIENTRNELIPAARSAAIDAGAYGGSRDMLTRERVQKNLENQIVAQAAADIANQRAQTPALLAADASSVNNYLNAGTAANNLLINAAQQQQQADMAKTNYLWDLAMQYGTAMGSSQVAQRSSIVPWVSGLQGGLQGAGAGLQLYKAWNTAPSAAGNASGGGQS